MDKIERVARAICFNTGLQCAGLCKTKCVAPATALIHGGQNKAARAAIAALRNPTPEMIAAMSALPVVKQIDGMAMLAVIHGCEGLPTEPTAAVQIWNTGIDRILKE